MNAHISNNNLHFVGTLATYGGYNVCGSGAVYTERGPGK